MASDFDLSTMSVTPIDYTEDTRRLILAVNTRLEVMIVAIVML